MIGDWWLVVVGCFLLVVGCWLLVVVVGGVFLRFCAKLLI